MNWDRTTQGFLLVYVFILGMVAGAALSNYMEHYNDVHLPLKFDNVMRIDLSK